MHNVPFQYIDVVNILLQIPLPYFASSINFPLIFKCSFFLHIYVNQVHQCVFHYSCHTVSMSVHIDFLVQSITLALKNYNNLSQIFFMQHVHPGPPLMVRSSMESWQSVAVKPWNTQCKLSKSCIDWWLCLYMVLKNCLDKRSRD